MSTELGKFLRARRGTPLLEPPWGGSGRRRTPGLRREEVAAQAGISVDYYIRLEQGRESNPSDSVLEALARTLGLAPDAVDHLYALRQAGVKDARPRSTDESICERMEALVDAVRPNPAYVLDRLSNVIAANAEGLALFEGLADYPVRGRNTCRYLVTHPKARETFLDWEDVARGAVAHLRAANAGNLEDPKLLAFVDELRSQSDRFDEWWDGHIVERRRAATKRFSDDTDSGRTRRYEVLHLPEDGLRMTLWLPA